MYLFGINFFAELIRMLSIGLYFNHIFVILKYFPWDQCKIKYYNISLSHRIYSQCPFKSKHKSLSPAQRQCVNLSRYIAQPHHHHHLEKHQRQELKDLLHHPGCKTNVIDLVSCHFHVSFSKLPKLQKTRKKRERKNGKCWWQIDVPAKKKQKRERAAGKLRKSEKVKYERVERTAQFSTQRHRVLQEILIGFDESINDTRQLLQRFIR